MVFSSFIVIAATMMLPVQTVQLSSVGNFGDSDRAEIEKVFSNYNQALVEKKYDELTRYIQAPFVVIDSAPRVITDIGAVIAGLRSNREALDQKGYGTSRPAEARISVLSSDRVLLNRIVRHYAKDGSLLEARANFYFMTKASGTWKISGVIQQDIAYVGKVK
jgi:hypothetical protein